MSLRWRIWTWLALEKGWGNAAYRWYCATIHPFMKHTCKVCDRSQMRVLGVTGHAHKVGEGQRLGALCRQCHKKFCGRKHRRKGTGFIACTVEIPDLVESER